MIHGHFIDVKSPWYIVLVPLVHEGSLGGWDLPSMYAWQMHCSSNTFLQVIAAKDLTRYRLQQIVTAREDDLLRIAPPSTVADLEKYGRETAAQLLLLQVPISQCDARCTVMLSSALHTVEIITNCGVAVLVTERPH